MLAVQGRTWYSKTRDWLCPTSFSCIVSHTRSMISSSFRKCTSRFVGWTLTSTERGSMFRLLSVLVNGGSQRGTWGAPEVDEGGGAFGEDASVDSFYCLAYFGRLYQAV